VSGALASHRYVRGRGRGGLREKGFPRLGRRMGGVDHLRAGSLAGVLPRGGGVLPRDSDHGHGPCHGPCRGRRGLGAPGRGESSGRAPLFLSSHDPYPYPSLCPYPYPHDHLVRGRDGLGGRSDGVPSHRDGGESGL
jgi:hypothetical protein